MSALHAGALRRRLALEAPVDVADDIGGVSRSFVEIARLWASVAAVSGATRLEGDRLEQAITHRVVTRWRDDVTGGMRLRLGLRVLTIRAVRDPDGARRVLAIDCEETTP